MRRHSRKYHLDRRKVNWLLGRMMESSMESSVVNAKREVDMLNDTNFERFAWDMIILMAGKGLTLIVQGLETYPASSSTTLSTSATCAGSSLITSTPSSS